MNDDSTVPHSPPDWPAVLETLHESETRFQEAFEHAAIGMALVSLSGRWMRVNQAACMFLGYTAAELAELTFQDLTYPPDLDSDLEQARQLLNGSQRSYQLEKRYVHRQGHLVWGLLSVSLVRGTDGNPRYFVSQIQDITARKQIEMELRASEERFRILFEHSPDGVLLLDPHHPSGDWPIVDCNQAACAMNGYSRETLIGQSIDVLNATSGTPSSRAAYLEALRHEGRRRLEAIHRHADGNLFPVMVSTTLITLQGREYVLGIDRDMTAIKAAEEALHRVNAELATRVAALERHAQAMQLLTDMGSWLQACHQPREVVAVIQHIVATICPEVAAVVALETPAGVVHERWGTARLEPLAAMDDCRACHDRQPCTSAHECRACGHVDHSTPILCLPLLAPGGALGLFHIQAAPGKPLTELQQQVLLTIADQSALALASIQLQQSLHEQAIRDPLTGLFNRRWMEASLVREIHRAERRGLSIGVLLVDIDHFKHFNDTYGHQAGDAVLRVVGRYLQSHIRGEDIACRYGGEEFLLILTDVAEASVMDRVRELHRGIRRLTSDDDTGVQHAVTASIGVALFPLHGTTVEALVREADTALYHAKQAGRDQAVLARHPDTGYVLFEGHRPQTAA